jgi:omega-amidase
MVGIYRKLHLFGLMEEDQYLAPGAAGLTMDLPWGTTGMAICYDLRFPELFRRYATQDGARLIVVPAEWPLERIDHWRALLVARAIENQAYIIATNAAGKTGDTVFGGHSMVIDPWGNIMVEAGETSQLLTVELDLTLVDTVRKRIPVFDDMRLDIYG